MAGAQAEKPKTTSKEKKQSSLAESRRMGLLGVCAESAFCPCIVYGRTTSRLENARNEQDAIDPSTNSCLNTSCLKCCVFFPFYGTFICQTRREVRELYGLNGTEGDDMYESCCYPCCTISHCEKEIYEHEKQRTEATGRHSPSRKRSPSSPDSEAPKPSASTTEYKIQKPMTHTPQDSHQSASTIKPPIAKSAAFGGKELEVGLTPLEPIREMTHESSTIASSVGGRAGPSRLESQDASGKASGRNSLEGSKWTIMQHLGRFWNGQNPDRKENDKPKPEGDTLVEKPTEVYGRHSLDSHKRPAAEAVSQHAAHSLGEHSTVAADASKSRFKEHLLENDSPGTRSPIIRSPHILARDPVLSRVNSPTRHHLESDSGASSRPAATTGHGITHDLVLTRITTTPSHQLSLDPLDPIPPKGLPDSARHDIGVDTIINEPSPISHTLHEDMSGDPVKRSIPPHHLEADDIYKKAISDSHDLESDAQPRSDKKE